MLFCGHVISDRNGEEIAGMFYVKELQKINQKEFRIEKLKEKVINYIVIHRFYSGASLILFITYKLISIYYL